MKKGLVSPSVSRNPVVTVSKEFSGGAYYTAKAPGFNTKIFFWIFFLLSLTINTHCVNLVV